MILDGIAWGSPQWPPSKLQAMLPRYYAGKWMAGSTKFPIDPPHGRRAFTVRAKDRIDVYYLPKDVPALVAKCAFRWHYGTGYIGGTNCNFTV